MMGLKYVFPICVQRFRKWPTVSPHCVHVQTTVSIAGSVIEDLESEQDGRNGTLRGREKLVGSTTRRKGAEVGAHWNQSGSSGVLVRLKSFEIIVTTENCRNHLSRQERLYFGSNIE